MKQTGTGVGVGTSSILMVFVLLCLTTFATLSLVSANADYKLATKAGETSAGYYRADAEAEALLSQLSDVLRESAGAATEQEYRRRYREAGERLSHPVTFEGTTASFSITISDTQRLDVVLSLPYGGGELYQRLRWQVVPTALQTEEDNEGLNLWGGDDFSTLQMF